MNVKVFRMSSGEDVVADVLEDKEDSLVIMNPIVAFNQGDGRLGFAPYAPLLKREEKELVDQYEEMFSPLKTPSKKLIL